MMPTLSRGRLAGAAVACGFTMAVIVGLETHRLISIDMAVMKLTAQHYHQALHPVALIMFRLGQTYVYPAAALILTLVAAVRRRSLRPPLVLAVLWLAHTLVVGAVKVWAGRQAPGTADPTLHATVADLADRRSFPSGHLANITVYTAAVGVLLTTLTGRRHWQTRIRAVTGISILLCGAGMLYLNFHWCTDAIAGLTLGLAIRLVAIPLYAAALVGPGGGTPGVTSANPATPRDGTPGTSNGSVVKTALPRSS